jgi:hypothetical protein
MTLNQGSELTAFVRKHFKAHGVKARCSTKDFLFFDVTVIHPNFRLTISEYTEPEKLYIVMQNLLP